MPRIRYTFRMMLHKKHTMKRPLFFCGLQLRWVPVMFLVARSIDAPLVAHPSEPVKPIKTWVGNASWYGTGFRRPQDRQRRGVRLRGPDRGSSYASFRLHRSRRQPAQPDKFEVVRINDRGPYQEGREIDVSYRVARKIGLTHAGVSTGSARTDAASSAYRALKPRGKVGATQRDL